MRYDDKEQIEAARGFADDEATEVSESDVERLVMLPLPEGIARMESGPIQFGDDWPGIFLRGDNAIGIAIILNGIVDSLPDLDPIAAAQIRGTADSLMSCKAI